MLTETISTLLDPLFIASTVANAVILPSLYQARKQIQFLSQCPIFQCLTREGVDRHWQRVKHNHSKYSVLFLDIDFMHDANERYGWEGTNQRIAASLQEVRSSELVGRWQRGDELIILTPNHEASRTAQRIMQAFQHNGLSITVGVASCESVNLCCNVQSASALVHNAKLENRRGTIAHA
jgi:diguanylate cyclase (GGDEF)-like protein